MEQELSSLATDRSGVHGEGVKAWFMNSTKTPKVRKSTTHTAKAPLVRRKRFFLIKACWNPSQTSIGRSDENIRLPDEGCGREADGGRRAETAGRLPVTASSADDFAAILAGAWEDRSTQMSPNMLPAATAGRLIPKRGI